MILPLFKFIPEVKFIFKLSKEPADRFVLIKSFSKKSIVDIEIIPPEEFPYKDEFTPLKTSS